MDTFSHQLALVIHISLELLVVLCCSLSSGLQKCLSAQHVNAHSAERKLIFFHIIETKHTPPLYHPHMVDSTMRQQFDTSHRFVLEESQKVS